jgi:predicted anti-sigma-YlaC factor YlaD
MTCLEALEVLSDYLAGELPMRQLLVLDEHLSECDACREYLRSFEQTIRLGKAAWLEPKAEALYEMPDSLVEAILAARKV